MTDQTPRRKRPRFLLMAALSGGMAVLVFVDASLHPTELAVDLVGGVTLVALSALFAWNHRHSARRDATAADR